MKAKNVANIERTLILNLKWPIKILDRQWLEYKKVQKDYSQEQKYEETMGNCLGMK